MVSNCERAITLTPVLAGTLATCAECLVFAVIEPARSVDLIKRAMCMSPIYPDRYLGVSSRAHWLAGDHDAAIADAKRLLTLRPQWASINYTFQVLITLS